jgi:hypothetical protein
MLAAVSCTFNTSLESSLTNTKPDIIIEFHIHGCYPCMFFIPNPNIFLNTSEFMKVRGNFQDLGMDGNILSENVKSKINKAINLPFNSTRNRRDGWVF